MSQIVVGCDTNTGNDATAITTVTEGLKQAGYDVAEQLPVGPSPFSKYGYSSEAKGKIGIYLMAASLFSFADGAKDLYEKDIFIIRGDASALVTSQEAFETSIIPRDADCNSVCNEWEGMTYPQMNQKAQGKCVAVYGGKTGEEMLQAAINALNGLGVSMGDSTNTNNAGGTAIQIKDKTFYGLIKQMLGAIDGIFTIANNMAYLLSFKDMYKYRDLYEEYIPEIKASDILIEGVRHDWTTEGLYNAVEVTYADGIIKYQHDALVEIYGENTFYYEFPEDDEETAKSKARALLSAHIRDYSLDIQIDCLYNPNITVGSWVKIPKTLTNVTTTQMSGPIKTLYKATEKKVRKGVNISNINEISNQDKTIQHITTEDGEQYDVEIEKKDYEIYFVQGYRMRWTPKQAPIMHLTLKYGPDTPEDPVNATVGIGGIQNTTGAAAGGFGDDCFYVCEIMPNNNAYINQAHILEPGDLEKPEFAPQEQHTRPRCKQDSNLAKDVAGKTPEEAYVHIRSKFAYCYYAESSALWPCVSDMYDQACGANCGDTTRLLKCAFDAVGVKSWGVHIHGHYFNALELNGKWVVVDGTGSYDYSNTAGFPIPSKPPNCCEPNQQAQANTC